MSHSFRFLTVAVLATSSLVYAHAAPASYVGQSQDFSLVKATEIPGGTLKPGDYTIQILDQLSDRMIVRVDNTNGKQHSIFLGIPHSAFADASGSGPADWRIGAQSSPALRGFAFSNGSTVEFVYPKAEAATIATKNAAKVVAVDPESEGRPQLTKMSQDDMKVVTLWMLTLTTAAPNSKTPALLAQRYSGDENVGGTVIAQNSGSSAPAEATNSVRQSQQSQPRQVASLEQPSGGVTTAASRHHAVNQLPHTASELPLIWVAGLLSLLAAAMLRVGRLALGEQ